MPKPQRSPLWRFFSATSDGLASCNICRNKLSYKTTTSNLKKHMQSKHPTVSLQFITANRFPDDDEDDEVHGPTAAKVPRISSAVSKLQRFVHESNKPTSCNELNNLSRPERSTTSTDEIPGSSSACDITQDHCPRPTPSFVSTKSGQLTQQQTYLPQCVPKNMSVAQKTKTDETLLKLFTKDFQPFSILEDEGFVEYTKALNPSYVLPSRKIISKSILPAKFEEVLTDVQSKVDKAASVCLTTDSWTSINTENFVAVTAHYIDSNFKLQSLLLQCEQFSGRHTSENIAEFLKELASKWNINEKIVLAVTDNASNISKAIRDLKWKNFGCFAHSLNLVVKDALNADQTVVELLEKIRKLVSHFKRSTNSTEKLMTYQRNSGKHTPKKLVQDVPTRWNSTYFMLRRFILLQEPLKATMALIDKNLPVLTNAEWKTACELMAALKSFFSVTNTVGGENYATASLVIPLCLSLASICKKVQAKTYTNEAKKVVACLAEGLSKRFGNAEYNQSEGLSKHFGNVEYNQSLTLATFLDPRFKNVVFLTETVGDIVKQSVVAMISTSTKEFEAKARQIQDESAENLDNENQKESDELSIWTDLDKILAQKKKKGTHYSRAIVEVDRYLEDDLLDRKSDPLAWWKENGHQYPNISKICQKHFCSLATSVPCERAFSKAGMFVTERRNRLSSNKTKILMFLNHNVPSACSVTPRSVIKEKDHDGEEEEIRKIVDAILNDNNLSGLV